MVDVMDHWFNDPDFGGCMFLNTAIEFPNPNDPIHQAAAQYKRKSRDHRRDLAKAAGATPANAETFADCYTALIEGALVLRQTQGRNDAAKAIRPAVEQLMTAYIPKAAETGSLVIKSRLGPTERKTAGRIRAAQRRTGY
jgi:hypothetical protein